MLMNRPHFLEGAETDFHADAEHIVFDKDFAHNLMPRYSFNFIFVGDAAMLIIQFMTYMFFDLLIDEVFGRAPLPVQSLQWIYKQF